MNVLVTGASGLLGRAIVKEFESHDWNVVGLAFSRSSPKLKKVDLRNPNEVKETIEKYQVQNLQIILLPSFFKDFES